MKKSTLFFLGMVLVAFNLRPALTGVGPITSFIQGDLGISASLIGFLTMLPLIAFGFMSLGAPALGAKVGNSKAILIALIVLIIGISLRSIGGIELLFLGTILIGIGIATGNVLVPSFVKESFPKKASLFVGVYSAVLSFGAAIGSGITAPIATSSNWRIALACSGILVILALIVWIPVTIKNRHNQSHSRGKRPAFPLSQSLAWFVTLFMGIQSLLFYSLVNWMPTMLEDRGVSISMAGTIVMVMQLASLPAILVIPYLAEKYDNQKVLATSIGIVYFIGLVGVFYLPASLSWLFISSIITGLAQGASVCLALLFVNLRAKTPSQVMVLSGMAQSFGYFIAAIGPISFGVLHDVAHSWTPVIICLLVFTLILSLAGWRAGRRGYIVEKDEVNIN
ncbi:CynX/NimT family MFS transporter [Bacillus massiliigorillae]|uniref:CynX/NimT family MFS transporter n=1 Tax=Bacillus massiliigorillae TaxID=1243664 RepID=UPI00039EDB07|nr:MFS transporter [Bacillus massiliigorillae]